MTCLSNLYGIKTKVNLLRCFFTFDSSLEFLSKNRIYIDFKFSRFKKNDAIMSAS